MTKSKSRPVFNIRSNDDEDVVVSAGGVILYRINNNQLELLMMTNRGKYEDLGGTTDNRDKDIYDTIAREVWEESNELIDEKSIRSRIEAMALEKDMIISKTSKYVLFIMKANSSEKKLTSEQFGDREIHDDIPRTVDWISIDEFLKKETIKDKLNFRLKNKNVFDYLRKLNPNQPLVQPLVQESVQEQSETPELNKNTVYLF